MENQSRGSTRVQGRRDTALDGLRTLAVFLMIASHSTRLIVWDSRRAWSRFSLLIEPLTASLFLVLVGASLAYSWRFSQTATATIEATGTGNRKTWFRKQSFRAVGLWALSCLFYILDEGFHWPDAIFMSGILATIAYTILVGMVFISLKHSVPVLILLVLILFGLHVYLDQNQIQTFFINAGNSPMIPMFLFACLGALAILLLESHRHWIRLALVIGSVLTLIFVFQKYSLTEVFSKPVGRYDSVRILATRTGAEGVKIEKSVAYYNLRPILVPVISSLVILIYAGLALLRRFVDPVSKVLFLMGRHSLDVYILHLALLAILVLTWGLRPLKLAWHGDAIVLGLILICYFWTWIRERRR